MTSGVPSRAGLNAGLVRAAQGLGAAGVLGLGLLAFAAAFYFSTIRPGQTQLDQMRREQRAVERRKGDEARAEPVSARERLDAFYAFFPRSDRTADPLEKIFQAAARQALRLEQGDYRLQKGGAGGVALYQVILPLKGTYPQVRRFVDAALAQVPNLALDSIQFERQKVGDPSVEAKVKFVLYLRQRG